MNQQDTTHNQFHRANTYSWPTKYELYRFSSEWFAYYAPCGLPVSDERRRSAHLFLVEVPAHHSAPSSAAVAEGSRADCIKQSVFEYKCLHGSAPVYLTDELCQVADVEARQQLRSSLFIFIIDCQPHLTPYRRWPSFPGRRCMHVSGTVCQILLLPHLP